MYLSKQLSPWLSTAPSYLNSPQMYKDTGAFCSYLELVLVPIFSQPTKGSFPWPSLTEIPNACSSSKSALLGRLSTIYQRGGISPPNTSVPPSPFLASPITCAWNCPDVNKWNMKSPNSVAKFWYYLSSWGKCHQLVKSNDSWWSRMRGWKVWWRAETRLLKVC